MRAPPRQFALVGALVLPAGCRYGVTDLPPAMFARDEGGEVAVYIAQCESSPAVYDRLVVNRIDEERGPDGRNTHIDATTVWSASADEASGPVPLPARLVLFDVPPGMHADAREPEPVLDVEAVSRLVAFGPTRIEGADVVISELRQRGGQFDLAGRRFDESDAMLAYACSDEFADAWQDG